jgi:hypothetical protein
MILWCLLVKGEKKKITKKYFLSLLPSKKETGGKASCPNIEVKNLR